MSLARVGLAASSLVLVATIALADEPPAPSKTIDLTDAVLLFGPGKATSDDFGVVSMLGFEAVRRRLRWPTKAGWEEREGHPAIVVALGTKDDNDVRQWAWPFRDRMENGPWPSGPEAYRIEVDPTLPAVLILASDARGAMVGAGRLLREIRFADGKAVLPTGFHAAGQPSLALRGHQLGYRAKTNSYDAWDRTQWFRYIHELAVFGANAIELVPPRTDDDLTSPHFPLPPLAMLGEMSAICKIYGLQTWLWFPVMDAVDTDPAKIEPLLKEWDEVFRTCKRLDAVFVPGGDPGSIPPKPLFAFLEKAAEVLHRSHPKATIWVSPQGFDSPRMDDFLQLVKAEPKWLAGVVFGPQVRIPLPELRKVLPAKLPIRGYPDITHSRQCQHPVPDWDLAYAVTEGREAINPRPRAMAAIATAYRPHTVGFLTYSEGCNDDVNKAIWSALGCDPEADVVDLLRQYARYFLDPRHEEGLAQALLSLERNWSGPLLTNAGVETTLHQLQGIEAAASPALRANWRFQQLLYRAYYDAYVRDRLVQESTLQHEAMGWLRQAPRVGSVVAIREARARLDVSLTQPVSLDRRARVFELGEALFQSVRMQLSQPKYLAIAPERGANLDTIDTPLNDREWLTAELARIEVAKASEPGRQAAIAQLVARDDPGPGGFYDDLGNPTRSPHLVRTPSPADDPLLMTAAFQGFALRTDWPVAWRQYTQTFHDAPIVMSYDGLDPTAEYVVRVVYSGDSPRGRMKLEADNVVVHDLFVKPNPVAPVEFPIPRAVTADGALTLTWHQEPGRGGNGRGCQVAEVWLLHRVSASSPTHR